MSLKKKILKIPTLNRHLATLKSEGKKVGFTNGCFDILHYGHVTYLEKARKKCDVLIVGLNSDSSVRKLKGPKRPINVEEERAVVLAALACVDFVVIFSEETPYHLIKAVNPHFLFKGADWKGKEVVGGDLVRANGGRVHLIHYVPHCSTTKTIKSIVKREK